MRQGALGLLQHDLERPWVDLSQYLPFFDQVPFLKVDLHELAVHAGLNRHCIEGRNIAQSY